MTRRQIREEIFKAIFQADFHEGDSMPEQVSLFLQEMDPPIKDGADSQYIQEKSNAIIEQAINEAVELARQYGEDNSSAFVNGVLAKLIG